MPRLHRNGRPLNLRHGTFDLTVEIWRVPDRAGGRFQDSGTRRVSPIGRPGDIFGDALVSLARVKAMEGRHGR